MIKVHFLGIGGSGASAAAAIAESQGFEITGCDLEPHNEFTTEFKPGQLFTGHDPKHLACNLRGCNVDILAVTPAIFSLDPNNPEVLAAKEKGILTMTWQQFAGEYLAKDKFVIAVCGTHGKTTTTAMIAQLLEDTGLDPTVLLGAIVPKWKTNYRIGKSRFLVVEADEFNDNFLPTKPDIAVVTNIEMDHPEYFKDLEAVKESFKKFLLQTKETIVANLQDLGVAEVLKDVMKEIKLSCFDYSSNRYKLELKIPGGFNQSNASATFQVGLLLGIDPKIIKQSLQNYTGVNRRFEYIGDYSGAKVYSDFGHHPTEIKVTMEAARQKFPNRRILLVYQPHMFSRTKALFDDFVKVFQNLPVDKVFIMDIYPSREIDTGLVTSKQLVDAVSKDSVNYIGSTDQTLQKLKPEIKSGDIVFFMSAGDTDKLAKELVEDTFKNKKILIFGLGLNQGGVGSAEFFAKQGADVKVTDLKTAEILKTSLAELKEFKDITYTLGEHKYEDIDWADLIIKNPAVKPGNPYIEYARKKGKQVEMDMGIFLQFVKPNQIIGVTGTKGKSTTASLIYEILKTVHLRGEKMRLHLGGVILAGNIGKSVLDTIPYVTPDTLIVLEISSFQLESFDTHKMSPKWAVITNITPDHLNYHKNMEEYVKSKKIIGKYQTKNDFLFIREGDLLVDKTDFLAGLKANIIRFSKNDLPKDFTPQLLGEHNKENMAAALAVGKIFDLNETSMLNTLSRFKGIPFRMELVKIWNRVKIYNDTAATSPEAGIQAVKTFPGCILICGGMNKGMDYTNYTTTVGKNVKKVFFLEGDSTEEIKNQLSVISYQSSDIIAGTYNNLEVLLKDVKALAQPGDIILFSPAATSFNLFQNEFDRGRKFNQAVERVFI